MTVDLATRTLIGHVVHGDQAAFAQLYRNYRTPALKFCLHLLKDRDEAENMVHDLFVKLWERRASINPDLNFNSFLFTCLRNLTFDYLKQVEKSQQFKQRYLERMETFRDEDTADEEARVQRLQTAIDGLSHRRKAILLLSIEEGKSYGEIAELLRISKNTVKNQLVKARQLLRETVDVAIS
ncbi:RNA polymerase sigma factor [Rudanella lutea]|uniref:RNA polymerase sigma factor n=1 Tax=Rudanella lutea TaxID=451374 RepID=UPI00036F8A8E|nr:RNA polymerase sigma-70 factor [Rudanella lutea]